MYEKFILAVEVAEILVQTTMTSITNEVKVLVSFEDDLDNTASEIYKYVFIFKERKKDFKHDDICLSTYI
jgi:hypothetical protein